MSGLNVAFLIVESSPEVCESRSLDLLLLAARLCPLTLVVDFAAFVPCVEVDPRFLELDFFGSEGS